MIGKKDFEARARLAYANRTLKFVRHFFVSEQKMLKKIPNSPTNQSNKESIQIIKI